MRPFWWKRGSKLARRTRRNRGEHGQATVAMVLVTAATLVFAMFAIDYGAMWLEHTRQSDMLQQAEAVCMEPAAQLRVKNSSNPGRDMCTTLVGELREAGFAGEVEAYYYELTSSDGYDNPRRRPYAFGATVKSSPATMFATLVGLAVPDVQSRSWTHAQFYASEKVWRPSVPTCGRLSVGAEAPASSGSWTPAAAPNEALMPGVGEALAKARLAS